MQRIRSEVMTMAKENAVDKLEVSRLEAPVRIQQIAEQKLKMSLPFVRFMAVRIPPNRTRTKGDREMGSEGSEGSTGFPFWAMAFP